MSLADKYFSTFLSTYKFLPGTTDEEKIIFAHVRGFSQRIIKKTFHFGSDKISRTIRFFNDNGVIPKPLEQHPKTKLTPEVLAAIHQTLETDARTSFQKLQQIIKERFEIAICIATLASGCRQLNFKYMPPKHTMHLTPQQKAARVSFAYSMLEMFYQNAIDPSMIVFSDESRFVLGDDKRWVWRRRGSNVPSAFVSSDKFPPSIMIYGAIGVDYKSKLVVVDGSINSDKYQDNIIESGMIEDMDELRGKGNWIFMQDGARCHTSADSIAWIGSQCKYIAKWPANSPDLNPIETLWGSMKKAVSKIKPDTICELKQVVAQVWESWDQEKIDHLVLSFFQRLQLLLMKNGNTIQPYLRGELFLQNLIVVCPENVHFVDDIIAGLEYGPNHIYKIPIRNKNPFTKEEDKIIIECYAKGIIKHELIAKRLDNRSGIQVKNRLASLLKNKNFTLKVHFD